MQGHETKIGPRPLTRRPTRKKGLTIWGDAELLGLLVTRRAGGGRGKEREEEWKGEQERGWEEERGKGEQSEREMEREEGKARKRGEEGEKGEMGMGRSGIRCV